MKHAKQWLVILGLSGLSISAAFANSEASSTAFQNETDKASYALGYHAGKAFQQHDLSINTAQFASGMNDGINNATPKLSEKAMKRSLTKFQQQNVANEQTKNADLAVKNQKAGADFLAKNKTLPGVKTTDSGLQYKVITPGTGPVPTKDSTVTVDYEGTLINGTVFDSSYQRGTPATFNLSQVIPGWTEALSLMQTGATWQIFVPAELAYGANGIPGTIGPNETLIFKVHLIKINK